MTSLCMWCGTEFEPRSNGGSAQRFWQVRAHAGEAGCPRRGRGSRAREVRQASSRHGPDGARGRAVQAAGGSADEGAELVASLFSSSGNFPGLTPFCVCFNVWLERPVNCYLFRGREGFANQVLGELAARGLVKPVLRVVAGWT